MHLSHVHVDTWFVRCMKSHRTDPKMHPKCEQPSSGIASCFPWALHLGPSKKHATHSCIGSSHSADGLSLWIVLLSEKSLINWQICKNEFCVIHWSSICKRCTGLRCGNTTGQYHTQIWNKILKNTSFHVAEQICSTVNQRSPLRKCMSQ